MAGGSDLGSGSSLTQRGAGRSDDAGVLPLPSYHSRHHHGVLRPDHSASGRLRQLFSSHPDRRRGYGLPPAEYALVLDYVPRPGDLAGHLLYHRRPTHLGLDGLPAAERSWVRGRTGTASGAGVLGWKHRLFLHRRAARIAQFHRHHIGPASARHDARPDAADLLGVVHHRGHRIARLCCAAGRRGSAPAGKIWVAPAFSYPPD